MLVGHLPFLVGWLVWVVGVVIGLAGLDMAGFGWVDGLGQGTQVFDQLLMHFDQLSRFSINYRYFDQLTWISINCQDFQSIMHWFRSYMVLFRSINFVATEIDQLFEISIIYPMFSIIYGPVSINYFTAKESRSIIKNIDQLSDVFDHIWLNFDQLFLTDPWSITYASTSINFFN